MGEARRRKLAQGNTEASTGQALNESPAGWPLTNPKEQARLEGQFQKLGIDFSKPGFHDSAAFLAVERVRPEFLDDYARYVEVRAYSEAELQTALRKIEVAAGVVSAAVKADGRHGLCVTASGILSRMLDELGVWNFCVKGTMTVTFPPAVAGGKQFFHALDAGNFEAAHAFVVAPRGKGPLLRREGNHRDWGWSTALPGGRWTRPLPCRVLSEVESAGGRHLDFLGRMTLARRKP